MTTWSIVELLRRGEKLRDEPFVLKTGPPLPPAANYRQHDLETSVLLWRMQRRKIGIVEARVRTDPFLAIEVYRNGVLDWTERFDERQEEALRDVAERERRALVAQGYRLIS